MSAILESLNALSAAGLTAVLNTLWLALAVAAVMLVAFRLMPRVNGATRHVTWWAVLGLIVLMPLATLLHRPVRSMPPPVRVKAQVHTPAASSSAVKPRVAKAMDAAALPLAASAPHALYSGGAAATRVRIPIQLHPGKLPSRLLFLWMAVSFVLLGRIVQSYLHLLRLRNRARPASADLVLRFVQRLRDTRTSRTPQLLVSDEVISPLVAGFLHPVVILPETLLEEITEPELDYVLLHELAHVARRDDWTNLIGRLASAVFVLHPVAGWVLHRIEREREIACDDWVVAATGSAFKYAATLARMFEYCRKLRPELLATGMAHRSSNLRERIEILLRPRLELSPGASLLRVSMCIAACLALLFSGMRMPGWIALAKETTVAVAHNRGVPQSQMSAARTPLGIESSTNAVAPTMAALSPAHAVGQSSVTPAGAQIDDQDKTWRHEWKLTRIDSNSHQVRLSLILRNDNGNDRTNTQDVPVSSLSGFSLSMLDHDGPVKFEYSRDSGSIACEGHGSGGRASGPFTVILNPSFVSALQKMGYAAPRDDEGFSLVTSDVTLGYAQAVRNTGLTSSISDLIDLRDHGVNPDYLKEIKAADPSLSIDAIDSLFDHGVKPDYYKSMKTAAPQLSIEQIDSLFDHGVKADSYKGFASVAPKLSIDEIDSLCDHGVTPEYYQSMKSVEPNLTIEQIDSLFDHGVKADSYKGFASVDRKLSIAEIDGLFDHGVTPEFYQGIKATDPTVSMEEIDRLRDHGVEPEYLKEIRALPDRFTIAEISELRDHGITAKYIRNLHDLGMKNLKAGQIVRLREGN